MDRIKEKIKAKYNEIKNNIKEYGIKYVLIEFLKWQIAFVIGCVIVYSPAIITYIIGVILNNQIIIKTAYSIAFAIFTPILPIGWLVWVMPAVIIKFYNKFILKKSNSQSAIDIYKKNKGENNEDI